MNFHNLTVLWTPVYLKLFRSKNTASFSESIEVLVPTTTTSLTTSANSNYFTYWLISYLFSFYTVSLSANKFSQKKSYTKFQVSETL